MFLRNVSSLLTDHAVSQPDRSQCVTVILFVTEAMENNIFILSFVLCLPCGSTWQAITHINLITLILEIKNAHRFSRSCKW